MVISLENIVDNAILCNLLLQKEFEKLHDDFVILPPEKYLRDYKTVRVHLGRKCGKTHYILKNFQIPMPFLGVKGDLILVYSENEREIFLSKLGEVYCGPINCIAAKNLEQFVKNKKKDSFRRIWIDEPARCFKTESDLEGMFNALSKFNTIEHIVMLGE